MLERGSYIPWASHFRRYLNRKRENKKWLNKAIDEGPYEFRFFTPSDTEAPRMQKEEDLIGDNLKHYEVEIEAMNLILISIPNDIYNSVDACTTAKNMWQRVECLMRGTIQNQVDRETHFNNEFDQFAAEPGEALVSVYNRFAQLMNDLERNNIIFPPVTVNTKFLNCLQPEWLKAKKLEKLHDPLALVAHTGSSSRTTTPYYATHPSSVVDSDDDYEGDVVQNNYDDPLTSAMILLARAVTQRFSNPTNNRLRTSLNAINQAIVQRDIVNIQSKNSGNDGRNIRRSYVQEEIIEGTAANVQCYNCTEKGYYTRNCPNLRVWDSKYFMEQMLLAKQDEAGVILTDEQNDFLFVDALRMEEIKELSANICFMARIRPENIDSDAGPSYDSAFLTEVQTPSTSYVNPLFAKDNQEQKYPMQPKIINNTIGDDQIDSNIIFDEPNAEIVSQSQFIHDRDIIRDLEQQRDTLSVVEFKRQNVERQKTQLILKRQMSENEDKYHDIVLDLEAKLKNNVDTVLKIEYANPYTLKKAISQNPKLYDVSCLDDSKIHIHIRDTEDILDDATKSQIKMKSKMKDPIAIEKKQNVCTIDYTKLNALYEDFVPQKELSVEQKYFLSSYISSENPSNASSPYSSFETKPTVTPMPNNNMQDDIEKIQRDSIEIQEGMQKQINILENDAQRYRIQSLDFELQLQHEKERQKCESSLKSVCEISWISKMEKLESENMSLESQLQSLRKGRDNVKTEYKKLFDSIKKTRTQTQGEINEMIEHVNQKTHDYAVVRAQNQDLLITISELKAKLKNVEKGKFVNTKFDKANISNNLLCVTPINKQVSQKKVVAPKTKEKNVLSKTDTLQTSPKEVVRTNKNVIASGMYKVDKKQETNTNKAKSVLSSTGLRTTSSVRRPSNRDSSFKNSVLPNTNNSLKKIEVSDRDHNKQDVASNNFALDKKIVTNDDIKNALIAKNILIHYS
ncbi:retrovirus-related pol polyprotein from transposon TNT 1-94 [Tanacetum coccineum]